MLKRLLLVVLIGLATTVLAPPARAGLGLSAGHGPDIRAVTGSGVVQTRVIGLSLRGRPIVAYRLGERSSGFTAVVLGNMHGYPERAGLTVTDALLAHAPIRGVDLWVIPTMNPDGLAAGTRGNAAGVDLNRNFPVGWAPLPAGDHYSGRAPLSEPESKAMYDFLSEVRPARLVSLHQPLDGVDTTDGGTRDVAFRNALAANLGLPLRAFTCYSECHGSMTRWLTATQSGAAITVEFGQTPTAAYLSGQAATGLLNAIMVGRPVAPPESTRNPRGALDTVTLGPSGVLVAGWAYDPDAAGSAIRVHFYDSGPTGTVGYGNGITDQVRADVNRALGLAGNHGFRATLPVGGVGRHDVCAYAINVGRGTGNVKIGCRTYDIRAPIGSFDGLRVASGRVEALGWAVDPMAPGVAGRVHLYLSGPQGTSTASLPTTVARPDVARAVPSAGPRQGFDVALAPRGRGGTTVCAYSVGVRVPSVHTLLGCRVLDVRIG